MPDHLRAWLVLAQGHVRVNELQSLLERFGDVDNVVSQPRGELIATGLAQEKCDAISTPDTQAVDSALAWLDDEHHHLVAWGESADP